jgi:hypothetical protein
MPDDDNGINGGMMYYSLSDELRPFLPIAGFDDFAPAPEDETQKARNNIFFETRPSNYPLGGADTNPLEAGNMVQRGIRYAGGLDPLPYVYPGGLLTVGVSDPFGSRPSLPSRSTMRAVATDANTRAAVQMRLTSQSVGDVMIDRHRHHFDAFHKMLASDPAWRNANQSAAAVDTTPDDNNTMPLLRPSMEWQNHEQETSSAIKNVHYLPAQYDVKQPLDKDLVGRRSLSSAAARRDPLWNPFQRGNFTV